MAEVGAHPGAHRTWSEHFSMYLPIFLIMSSVFFTELKALICGMISSGKWNLNSNGRETIFFLSVSAVPYWEGKDTQPWWVQSIEYN